MIKTTRTIPKDANSDRDEPIVGENVEPVTSDPAGKRFLELADPDDPWKNYDPKAFRAALQEVAGLFTPEEADRLIENIYRSRDEGMRPIDRS